MSVTYEAKVRQTRWIAGARVVLDLRIENGGTAPFETPDPMYRTSPQPHFELTGPGGRKQEFRPDSRATEWDRGRPPTVVRLAPGQDWEGDFALSGYADLSAPGRYRLRSWIDGQGGRTESPAVEFEIVAAETRDLAAETSFGEENSATAECLELLEGGQVATSILNEDDPRNAELLPFNRVERGAAAADAETILAPYSNFQVGLSAVRWIVTAAGGKLTVGHNLAERRVAAFGGAAVTRPLSPIGTKAGLYLAALRGTELLLQRFTGTEGRVEAGPVWTVERFDAPPAAAALTVAPRGSNNALLFVLAWGGEKETRVRAILVSSEGQATARAEHTLPDVRPMGPAAAGWSTDGEMRAALVVRSAARATELRTAGMRFRGDLSLEGKPQLSEPLRLETAMRDARISYFEAVPGRLSRMGVVRTEGGGVFVFSGDGAPRAPRTRVPSAGPFAILPGATFWYGVWPEEGKLKIGPL